VPVAAGSRLRRMARRGFEALDSVFDGAFAGPLNPMRQLGALGWFFFWIVIVTGIYLYVFFDTGILAAYGSIERIDAQPLRIGSLFRSVHRYASDALVIVMVIHLFREYAYDRFRGPRWFAWITGVPLIWLLYVCGISGYWLVWDELAQYVAIGTSEWLDSLPLFAEKIARNFLHSQALGSRFFTLMVFIHILVPLIMLLVMWIHVQRHPEARINPPRVLAAGTLGALFLLGLAVPVASHAPADLDIVPGTLWPDWYYLWLYPLLDRYPGGALWGAVVSATLLLLALPWLPWQRRRPAARVDLANCNGCARCYADCPFAAIRMQPRSDGLTYDAEASVIEERCVSCGICAGACPTATPFRRLTRLQPGIDLPDRTIAALRDETHQASSSLAGDARILIYGCDYGPDIEALDLPDVATVRVRCAGMLPPPFLDYVLSRRLADGVVFAGCQDGNCHYRLGIEWTRRRIRSERDPHLRARVPRERILECWVGAGGTRKLRDQVRAFQVRLRNRPEGGAAGVDATGRAAAATSETTA